MATPNQTTQIVGAPKLAKIAGGIAIVVGLGMIATLQPETASIGVLALIAAWRLLRISISTTADEVVVRNLFATRHIPLADARVARRVSDLRTRTAWGGHALPKGAIPKMADDNMATHAYVLWIENTADSEQSTHTDCSIGLIPETQAELFNTLEAVIGS